MQDEAEDFLARYGDRADQVVACELAGALAARDVADAKYWIELRGAIARRMSMAAPSSIGPG